MRRKARRRWTACRRHWPERSTTSPPSAASKKKSNAASMAGRRSRKAKSPRLKAKGSLPHKLLQRRVHRVGDKDLAFRTDSHDVRLAKLAWPFAGLARDGQHLASQVHLHDLTGEPVHHERLAWPDRDAARQAGELHLAHERAGGCENLNPLVLPVCHPQVALRIDVQPMRHLKLAWFAALAAPL